MNFLFNPLRIACWFLMLAGSWGWSQGAIVWDGPVVNFNHPNGVGTSVQDQLTPGVWLTRDTSQGLINAFTETAYTHKVSPQDTEWAFGSLPDYATLGYTDWESWSGKKPLFNIVGQPAVVHLISENIYLSLTFTSWGSSGGAYSYNRSTPSTSVPEPSVWALGGLSSLVVLAARTRSKHRSRA